MKELTRPALYNYLFAEQGRIRSALDENEEGPESEVLRGQWAMAQKVIEDFGLRPEIEEMRWENGKEGGQVSVPRS